MRASLIAPLSRHRVRGKPGRDGSGSGAEAKRTVEGDWLAREGDVATTLIYRGTTSAFRRYQSTRLAESDDAFKRVQRIGGR